MQKPPCDKCRTIYKKKNKPTPCDKCVANKIKLLPENEEAFFIYNLVRNQAIFVGMDGMPVDLNYNAVKMTMDLYNIENQRECFNKVLKVWHAIAAIDRVKRKT